MTGQNHRTVKRDMIKHWKKSRASKNSKLSHTEVIQGCSKTCVIDGKRNIRWEQSFYRRILVEGTKYVMKTQLHINDSNTLKYV
jgi:hypothetical protein